MHAAGAVDSGADDEPVITVVREDIGRHNAVDKVVGRLLLDDALPAHDLGLFVSGRASFEIVENAWAAGFAAGVAVSAPSALAVDTARAADLHSDLVELAADPGGQHRGGKDEHRVRGAADGEAAGHVVGTATASTAFRLPKPSSL